MGIVKVGNNGRFHVFQPLQAVPTVVWLEADALDVRIALPQAPRGAHERAASA